MNDLPVTRPELAPRHVLGIADLSAAELATVIARSGHLSRTHTDRTLWALDETLGRQVIAAASDAAAQLGSSLEEVDWRRLWSAARRLPTPRSRPVVAAIVAAHDSDYVKWVASRLTIPVINAAPLEASAPTMLAAAIHITEHLGPLCHGRIEIVDGSERTEQQWRILASLIGLDSADHPPSVVVSFVESTVFPLGVRQPTITFPGSGEVVVPARQLATALAALVDLVAKHEEISPRAAPDSGRLSRGSHPR